MSESRLSVEGLCIAAGRVPLVEGVSFSLRPGHTLALVGESGCGKSVTSHAVMGLLPPPLSVAAGSVKLDGMELLGLSPDGWRAQRGRRIGMVFQEPMTALNPAHTVGDQVAEAVRAHGGASRAEARDRAIALLAEVRIPDPARVAKEFPHRLSGGMRQRVVIATAIAGGPAFLIADEPTTALDVTVQAQVLALLGRLQAEKGLGLLLITHNLGVVAQSAQEMAVMYAGRIVEQGPVRGIFRAPRHPYTRGLMRAVPGALGRKAPLEGIGGMVPSPGPQRWAGCAFAPRCGMALPDCTTAAPPLREHSPGHAAACFRSHEMAA
ncbi:ABC transporter ATP-binding protein [Humitalea sp. 24SJ18S-53]|uniref:ABC transporter ATP-binding protein n=1 Tax=Humitalea sp. 24SJ18S-53 TaxID=3422307 RepID=UPI003D6688A5